MMNPEEETSAMTKQSEEQEQEEKLVKKDQEDLTPDEFAFKSKLEMINSDEQRVDINMAKEDEQNIQSPVPTEPTILNQVTSAVGKVVYPLGEAPLAKSEAPLEVKESMQRKYYAMRAGVFEHAVEDVKRYLKPTVDGNFVSAWLLAEIDHWDHEKERIIILTDTLLVLIKYNFVASRIEECRRIQLHRIDRVQGGRFQYPEKTMMMPRSFQTGIRISWNKNEVLSKWQRFSPFFNSPAYVTFTQHKGAYYLDDLPNFMVYENFKADLLKTVQSSGAIFETVLEPIFIEVYVGAMSIVHNSSDLGYSKDRGMASF